MYDHLFLIEIIYIYIYIYISGFLDDASGKEPAANAGDIRDADADWIPGWGRSLGGGHGNPLPYSCQEKPMDRGAWQRLR